MAIFTSRAARGFAATLMVSSFVFGTNSARAEFTLNFQPVAPAFKSDPGNIANMDCRVASTAQPCIHNGNIPLTDKTPFFQELATDGVNQYYHVIMGDPATDFVQEYFIRSGATTICCWSNGAPLSASAGWFNGGVSNTPGAPWSIAFESPLASDPTKSGNGTANPERVIFRQRMVGEVTQEVIKPFLLTKPKITQTMTLPDLETTFQIDMTAIRYNDKTTKGTITNTVSVIDPTLPNPNGRIDFDAVANAQRSTIVGGRYTYTPPASPPQITAAGGSFGTYSYEQSNFDVYSVDWAALRNPSNGPAP